MHPHCISIFVTEMLKFVIIYYLNLYRPYMCPGWLEICLGGLTFRSLKWQAHCSSSHGCVPFVYFVLSCPCLPRCRHLDFTSTWIYHRGQPWSLGWQRGEVTARGSDSEGKWQRGEVTARSEWGEATVRGSDSEGKWQWGKMTSHTQSVFYKQNTTLLLVMFLF